MRYCADCDALTNDRQAYCSICYNRRRAEGNPYPGGLPSPPQETSAGETLAILGLLAFCIFAFYQLWVNGSWIAFALFTAFGLFITGNTWVIFLLIFLWLIFFR